MKKFLTILILIFLTKINTCYADIIKADNIEILEKELYKADANSLVIFDIDDVLIAPTNEFMITDPIRKALIKEIRQRYSKNEERRLFSDFFQKRTVRLVNNKMPELINKLKEKGIPMTALTGWWTGNFGNIPKMEDLRFKGLNEVGISFAETSPFKKGCTFPELKTNNGGTPLIKNGIIITALNYKGKVLKAALEKSNLKFNNIIFIDDNLQYLQSVEEACKELNTNFLGIHYTEAASIPSPEIDEYKEKLRFKILEKEHKWLSDKELKELL